MEEKCHHVLQLADVIPSQMQEFAAPFKIVGPRKTKKLKKINFLAVVRKRTISTERPPLVGEVSANLCG
jgi:hypothetical protein